MSTIRNIDRIDKAILDVLSVEGRLPVTNLAERVGISKSPCQVRLKRLEKEGFIQGYRAEINHEMVENSHVAFVEIKLRDTTEKALAAFNLAVRKIPEIESCHLIAGAFDYLLKVRTRDITVYRQVLGEKIAALPHLANSSTYVSMQTIFDTPLDKIE